MSFLRRILGRGENRAAAVDDGIQITASSAVESSSPPPAPVIEAPPKGAVPAEPPSRVDGAGPNAPVSATTKPLPEAADPAATGTRPLSPFEPVSAKPGQRLRFGQRSDVGMVRGNNQDSMFGMVISSASTDAMPDIGMFVVADGMGGHQEGERASAITVRTVSKVVLRDLVGTVLDQRMGDPNQPSVIEILREAVRAANRAVSEEIPEGGTTVTALVSVGELAYIAHVGDSRCYLVTDDGMEQVTRDHSLVQRLIELDQLTPEEAAEHPQRNVLYRAIGQSETLDVDVITRRLPPGGQVLLCSDGLWNMVPEPLLFEIIRKHDDPQTACNELVQIANERGGPDNVTMIIIRVPG